MVVGKQWIRRYQEVEYEIHGIYPEPRNCLDELRHPDEDNEGPEDCDLVSGFTEDLGLGERVHGETIPDQGRIVQPGEIGGPNG